MVEDKLKSLWSPEQIAGWLRQHFPDDPAMRVSHEAIYLALFDPRRKADRSHLDAAVAHRTPDAKPETGPQT